MSKRISTGQLSRQVARGLVVLVTTFVTALVVAPSPGLAAGSTIVSLTFDDGHWSH